jgi:hypothetical protein
VCALGSIGGSGFGQKSGEALRTFWQHEEEGCVLSAVLLFRLGAGLSFSADAMGPFKSYSVPPSQLETTRNSVLFPVAALQRDGPSTTAGVGIVFDTGDTGSGPDGDGLVVTSEFRFRLSVCVRHFFCVCECIPSPGLGHVLTRAALCSGLLEKGSAASSGVVKKGDKLITIDGKIWNMECCVRAGGLVCRYSAN